MPWALHPPGNPEVSLHPTQAYMFFAEMLLLVYLAYFNKRKRYDGETFWRGLLLYSVYRWVIEFFRLNPVVVFGQTHAQIFSLVSAALAICVLAYYKEKFRLSR